MNILVTGGAGFIGSHVVDALVVRGHDVVVIDNLSTGNRGQVHGKAVFFLCDITDERALAKIFRDTCPEVVFHFAASISVRGSVRDPRESFRSNIIGSTNVIEAACHSRVKKLIVASTGGVMYSGPRPLPTPDFSFPNPQSPYAISKMAVDLLLNHKREAFGLPSVSLRCSNVYGPRQNPCGGAGVVAIFLERMLRGESPVIYGDGSATRDYIFIDDVVEAYMAALQTECFGIYNIGTGIETDVNAIFHLLNGHFGGQFEKRHGKLSVSEEDRSALESRRARRDLNWSPRFNIESGIRETVLWARERAAISP